MAGPQSSSKQEQKQKRLGMSLGTLRGWARCVAVAEGILLVIYAVCTVRLLIKSSTSAPTVSEQVVARFLPTLVGNSAWILTGYLIIGLLHRRRCCLRVLQCVFAGGIVCETVNQRPGKRSRDSRPRASLIRSFKSVLERVEDIITRQALSQRAQTIFRLSCTIQFRVFLDHFVEISNGTNVKLGVEFTKHRCL